MASFSNVSPVHSQQKIDVGVMLGYSGPIETLTGDMADAAELALAEASSSGWFLGGKKISPVRIDSTCVDTSSAYQNLSSALSKHKLVGIVGGDCSGVTIAIVQKFGRSNDLVFVSPSATSPTLSSFDDDGRFFRTAPSDSRMGLVLSKMVTTRALQSIAITYVDNDYGRGLKDSIVKNFTALGGEVTTTVPHQSGRSDYGKVIKRLSKSGGEALVVAGYCDDGGDKIIRTAINRGIFNKFILSDGMICDGLAKSFAHKLKDSFGILPASANPDFEQFILKKGGKNGPFSAESYDAAAILLLAMQAAGTSEGKLYKAKIVEVANGPGEPIYQGEIAKGLRILAAGGSIDYVGATNVQMTSVGDSLGNYQLVRAKNGKFTAVEFIETPQLNGQTVIASHANEKNNQTKTSELLAVAKEGPGTGGRISRTKGSAKTAKTKRIC